MPGLWDLEGHLVFYRSYHFNQTNVSIHLFCIPLILFTAIALLVPVKVADHPFLNLGNLMAASYSVYYTLLDFQFGAPTIPLLCGLSSLFTSIYHGADAENSFVSQKDFLSVAGGIHVAAWLAQFYGHAVHEKRAPALLDNLLQAVVLAPFFDLFEIGFALGYRLDLKKSMDNKAGVLVRDYKFKEAEKKKAKLKKSS